MEPRLPAVLAYCWVLHWYWLSSICLPVSHPCAQLARVVSAGAEACLPWVEHEVLQQPLACCLCLPRALHTQQPRCLSCRELASHTAHVVNVIANLLCPPSSVMGMSFIFLLLAFKWAAGKYR